MMKKFFTTAAVAGAMIATPAMAQDAAFDRLPAPAEQGEDLSATPPAGIFIGIAAVVAIVLGVIIATGENDADETLPTSP
ncbi:hypothetical protein [Aurantiacibacter sediminis]|uniref:Ferrochelatase n=1 Tax=Aurantiacibacter sediminis TaxID=2793064 RepID=A0ABS0N6E7_9SPHN|nr:hypothetical protein [Aurantiacibacter sediminis]MBH5323330.1 hypothetical protein [Aurantiacibacter sediminis]